MKKILLSILLILGLKGGVSAKRYYSDYSEFSDYNLEKIESSDLVNVEVKRVYNKYFSVAEGDYYRLGENSVLYPYINVNIYKDTEFTNWNSMYPEDKLGRIIEFKNVCDNNDCTINHLEYRYKDRLYFHYRNVEKLLDESSILKGYIKNEQDYISYYRYQVRDKIDISDEIIITSKNKTIDDFIDSTVPYQVIGNIDYSKNDIYNVNVITSFIKIPLKVEVLIIDNVIGSYKKDLFNKSLDIEKLNKQIELYKNKIITKEQMESNFNKQIESLRVDLNNKNKINAEIKDKNIWLENKIDILEKENSLYEKSTLECKNTNTYYGLKLLQFNNDIIFYKNKLSNLNKLLLEKDITDNNIIKKLNNKITDYELIVETNTDISKKLSLCNETNSNLNKKISNSKTIEKQNVVYTLFIGIIFFFIGCSVLKIKSIKKNN